MALVSLGERPLATGRTASQMSPKMATALDSTCWLCARPLGRRVEYHHPVPKSRGGRSTRPVHPICHRTLHTTFTNKELAKVGDDPAALGANPELARFLAWVAGKDPDFHVPTRRKRG